MKHISKRLLAFLLMLAMVFSMLPAMAFAAEDEQPEVELITAEDDALVEADILDDIDTYFDNSATRSGELTLADYVEAADDVKAMVMASDTYVEGSIVERGDGFFWQTTTGITCGYFPQDRYEADQRVATKAVNTSSLATWNYANATSKDVCLVAPMYSEDSTFTDQYVNEALAIAEALGGTAYGLIDTAATVTAIGQALEKCGVVIFDSHGNTDWGYFDGGSDGTGESDCVTEANTSYLCLSTGTGMTTADCAYVTGNFGTYPHAYKDSYGNYVADGTAFANHMNGNAPGSLLWMAICLGMSTEGFCTPLRNKGVEVVYGYSQSVTFYGDYLYEEYFWDKMCAGETVATAASYMKTTAGCKWDPYYSSYSESSARSAYAAFPVVVSDQDAYPGQRSSSSNGACSVQTVKSTYTLFSNYEVTATTNNSSWGTVSVSGNTITATPASGYYAAGATVTSGTATVTQNGNTFTVSAESDCTVQITFAAKTSVTVSFSGADGVSPMTGYAGDAMTLPTPTAPEGYAFVGWTTAPLADDVTTVPTNYVIYTPTASTTLYALYSYVEEGTSSGSGDYVKVTTAPADWSGEYVIVYEEGGLVFNSSLDTLDAVSNNQAVTITSNTISAAAGDPYKVTITAVDGGYSLLSTSGVYFGNTSSSSNSLKTSSDPLVNTISLDGEGNADIVSSSTYLRYNATSGQTRFRYYKSSTYTSQQPVALYVKDGSAGTTYYTSTTTSCEHNWVAGTVVAPTCTAGGYTNYSCSLCGAAKQDSFTNALGHNMVAGTVVAPTCTEEGYTEYACANGCGATDLGDIVDALGHNYVDGTCSVCGEAEPVTPPTTGYEGRYYIATIRSSGNYFYMSSDLGTSSTKRYQAVDSGLTTLPASIAEADVVANQVFVLELNDDGTYSIYAESVSGDNYLGWTSGNSGALVAASSAIAATVDYADGIYNIHFAASDAERYLALNGTTGNNYFAWYKSGQKQDLVLIPVGGSAVTPDPEPSCEHTNTTVTGAVAATCTTAGYTGDTVCSDCGETISTGTSIAALGHNYVDGTCSVCGEAEPVAPPAGDFSGRYYIAGKRTGDTNYQYIMGVMDGTRYDIEDSGVTVLPSSIDTPASDKVFVIEKNADGSYRIYAEGITGTDKYLGWTSGNSGSFVAEADALSLSIDALDSGLYNIHFTGDAERYLSLNATATLTYAAWYKTGQTKDLALIPVSGEAPSHVHAPAYFEGQAATCTEDGVIDYWYCSDSACPDYGTCYAEETLTTVIASEDLVIEATGHNMVAGTVVAPTCTEEGYTEYICANGCGTEDFDDIVAALGHDMIVSNVVAPTCTEEGYTEYICANDCGTTDMGDIVAALGHNMTYTDNGDGTHTYACANDCDVEDVIEEHAYVDGECPCGAVEETDPYLDASLKFMTQSLNLDSSILSQFILNPKSASGYDSFYVAFKHIDADGNVTETTSEGVAYYTYKVFEIASAAKEMSDTIEVTLYAQKDGVWYHGETISWILRDELTRALRASTNDTYKTLAATILNYGAAAQFYFSYNTGDLANSLLTAEELAYAKTTPNTLADNSSTVGSANGVTSMGTTLGLEGAIQMQFVFRASGLTPANLEARISYTIDGTATTDTIDGSEFGVMSSYITVVYDKLAAKDLRTVVTVGIYDKATGNLLSPEVSYSAESFCYQKLAAADTANGTHAMCTAIMCYVDAAADYFG